MPNEKYAEPSREEIKAWIEARGQSFAAEFESLVKVSASAGDEAFRFLGLAHLGGIAGCLGFIGAVKHGSPAIGIALAIFIVGVVSLLAAHFARYKVLVAKAGLISRQSKEFAAEPTIATHKRLQSEEAKFFSPIDWSLLAALASGAAFIVGAGIAAYAAFSEPMNRSSGWEDAPVSHAVVGPPHVTTKIVISPPSASSPSTSDIPTTARGK